MDAGLLAAGIGESDLLGIRQGDLTRGASGTRVAVVPSMSVSSLPRTCSNFWAMIQTVEPPDLGPGPRAGVLSVAELNGKLRTWFAPMGLTSSTERSLRATALLYHDHHDEAHDLVQDGVESDVSLIHAILHRREPDFWNSKYWFRRVLDHPIYRTLANRVAALAGDDVCRELAHRLTVAGIFDPFLFVDEIERVSLGRTRSEEALFLKRVQQAEFEVLAEHLLKPVSS